MLDTFKVLKAMILMSQQMRKSVNGVATLKSFVKEHTEETISICPSENKPFPSCPCSKHNVHF